MVCKDKITKTAFNVEVIARNLLSVGKMEHAIASLIQPSEERPLSRFIGNFKSRTTRESLEPVDIGDCHLALSVPKIRIPESDFVFWGRTRNQLAQFLFFEGLLDDFEIATSFLLASPGGFTDCRVEDLISRSLLDAVSREVESLNGDPGFRIRIETVENFFTYLAAWYISLLGHTTSVKAVVVANDHSPRYVAAKVAAILLRIPVVYLQHAPVTRIFPPIEDFDCVVLADYESQRVYEEISTVPSNTYVISHPICNFEGDLSDYDEDKLVAGIYLTRKDLLNFKGIERLVGGLQRNNHLHEVRIFPHPGVFPASKLGKFARLVSTNRSGISVPIVGNSGIVNELLAQRSHVYYAPELDSVRPFYHPVTQSQAVRRFSIEKAKDFRFEPAHRINPPPKPSDDVARESLKAYILSLT